MKGIKATYSTWGRTKDFLCAVGLKTMLNLKDIKIRRASTNRYDFENQTSPSETRSSRNE